MNATPRLPALIEAVESRAASFAKILPSTVSSARFIAAVKTALLTVPGLVDCDKQSVVLACMRCASDGLVPDGRDAVLVVGRSKRKDGSWANVCQYWPMSQGLQKIAFRSGLVTKLEPRVVYTGDKFELELGTTPRVIHKPTFGEARGDILGAYCVASLKGGGSFIEFMELDEIAGIMRRSKSFNRETNEPKGPWATDFAEMARKTVLRRALKYLPSEALNAHGDDEEEMTIDGELTEGVLSASRLHEVPGGTISSGRFDRSGDRPIEDLDPQEVADGEMLADGPTEPKTPDAAPGAATDDASRREEDTWKPRLRLLRDSLAAAQGKDGCEHAWAEWDAEYGEVPTEVTAAAKQLVDARLYALAKG